MDVSEETVYKSFEEMIGEFPETIYKYRRWTNTFDKRILTQKELFFASPRDFEDELDCKNTIRYENLTREEKLKFIEHHVAKANPKFTRQKRRFESREIFKNAPIRDYNSAKKLTDDNLEKFFDITGVFSVTGDPNSKEMWDKYADNSRGFCVGFDSLKLFKSELIGSGGKVDYVDKLPTLKPPPYMSGRESTLKQIFCKLKKWTFENEYRSHIFRGEKLLIEDRRIIAPADTFKEILIGSNMPDKDVSELKNQLHIDLKKIKIRDQ